MDIKRELEIMKEIDMANKRHLEEWRERMGMSFYFTFGSDPEYPFGRDDYVRITCKNAETACKLFNALHPKRPGSDAMNCAFMYDQYAWDRDVKQWYKGREPIEEVAVRIGSR